jgi:hypothetical protein
MRDDIGAKSSILIFPSKFLSLDEILNKYCFMPILISTGYQLVSK